MVVILASLFLPFSPQFQIKSNPDDNEALRDSNIIKDSSLPPSTINNTDYHYGNISSGAITPETEEHLPNILANNPASVGPNNNKRKYY